MDITLGKFFLDALKVLKSVFTDTQNKIDDLVATGTFLELYGSATRLQGYAQRIYITKEKKHNNDELGKILRTFFKEIRHFGKVLRKANLSAIEVFHPQLAAELAQVMVVDCSLYKEYKHSVLTRCAKLKSGYLKDVVDLYIGHYWIHEQDMWDAEYEMELQLERSGVNEWPADEVLEIFRELASNLQKFRSVIAEIIRETWDFKELATYRVE